MTAHFHRELDILKESILSLGLRVEEAIARAVSSTINRDKKLAGEVIAADSEINSREVRIEEECLKLLALYQPLAADLRFIIAALKINNDLERMGDLAVNIAKGTLRMVEAPPIELPADFEEMSVKVRSMIKRSLQSLVNGDLALAYQVCADDDAVDNMRRSLNVRTEAHMCRMSDETDPLVTLFLSVGHLERIADMATNIAEDVIYMLEGRIIRHMEVGKAKGP
jgi:phosphate transport system protein